MCQTSCAEGDRTVVSGMTFDDERALYGLSDAVVEGCAFAGPADGESALKECRDVEVRSSRFDLRYPLWHAEGFSMSGCTMSEACRAALWYDRDGRIQDCELGGPKALRECSDVILERCGISSLEFGWKCRGIAMRDCTLESEYPFLDCEDLEVDGLRMHAKYSFQYVRRAVIRNSVLNTKDAFWHSRDVTVEDSVIEGEYLGWYSENLTLVRCRISGTQPLSYCRNLRLIDCTMEDADLAFERSDVRADVRGHIDSVKNPLSGWIRADGIGGIVLDGTVDCRCEVRTGPGGTSPACPTATVSRCPGTALETAPSDSQTVAGSISNPLIPTVVLS